MSQNPESSQSVAGTKMEASPVTQPYADGGSSRPSSKLRFSSTFLKHLNLRFRSPNSFQSSAGKKMDASPVTQPDGSSTRSSLKHVTLYDWWLNRTEPSSGFHNLGVAGIHSDPRLGLQIFESAAISKRHRGGDLETSDGITITVVGSINRECTRQNGFSCEVCSHFLIGFPFDWEDYAGAEGSINKQQQLEEDAPVFGTRGRPSTKKRKNSVMKEGIQQEKSFLSSPVNKIPPLSESEDGESANENNTPNLNLKATKAATGLRKHLTGSQLGTKRTQKEEGKSVLVACKTSTRQLTLRSRSIDVNIKRRPS